MRLLAQGPSSSSSSSSGLLRRRHVHQGQAPLGVRVQLCPQAGGQVHALAFAALCRVVERGGVGGMDEVPPTDRHMADWTSYSPPKSPPPPPTVLGVAPGAAEGPVPSSASCPPYATWNGGVWVSGANILLACCVALGGTRLSACSNEFNAEVVRRRLGGELLGGSACVHPTRRRWVERSVLCVRWGVGRRWGCVCRQEDKGNRANQTLLKHNPGGVL